MSKTLATRVVEALKNNDSIIPCIAHAALVAGNVVQVSTAGVTSAPGANDRLGLFGVILEPIASGAEGRLQIQGVCKMMAGGAITLGSLVDVSADMKVDALAVQTDGNGFARVLETASAAGDLVWARLL